MRFLILETIIKALEQMNLLQQRQGNQIFKEELQEKQLEILVEIIMDKPERDL
jgi:hypothetical protein